MKENGNTLDDKWYAIGHRCIAAPIFVYTGKVILSINMVGHFSLINDNKIEENCLRYLKRRTREASLTKK